MFNTIHDAILLIFAALYVFVGLARAILQSPPRDRSVSVTPPGWYSVPFIIATALAVTAVLW